MYTFSKTKEFKYSGSVLTERNDMKKEISARIPCRHIRSIDLSID